MRAPERILEVADSGSFYRVLTAEEFAERLSEFLGDGAAGAPSAVDLARFRRRQLLRIVLRDVLGVATLSDVTEELSNLADAILDVTYRRIRAEFVALHGEPRLADGSPCGFSVISLGKLGGQELNYSSDIDLMFVYGGNGRNRRTGRAQQQGVLQEGRQPVHRPAFHLYRRRPVLPRGPAPAARRHAWARSAFPKRAREAYYAQRARDWEKQMLIKARVSAGEPEPGAGSAGVRRAADLPELAGLSRGGGGFGDAPAHRREGRRQARLAGAGWTSSWRPAAFAISSFWCSACSACTAGGSHGCATAARCWRSSGCATSACFPTPSTRRLANAYQFLRYLEHRLQMEEDRQTHTLPTGAEALDLLARKNAGG